jgi:hypothetical protein
MVKDISDVDLSINENRKYYTLIFQYLKSVKSTNSWCVKPISLFITVYDCCTLMKTGGVIVYNS